MTRLPILLHVVTDGEKCSRECDHWAYCNSGIMSTPDRTEECRAAEAAAREMEARAVERGFDMATVVTPYAQQRMRAELARIRGGDR